jgi:precorrin-6Y C5,15-methyltransferase (decarboxylating)
VAERAARVVPLAPGLDDRWFANDGQLTKAEIRAVTLAALAPRAGELLGMWARRGVGGDRVAAAASGEPRHRDRGAPDRAGRIGGNAKNLGAREIEIVVGRAPEALNGLPRPNAVFIGGGAAEPGVFEACWAALRRADVSWSTP